MRELRTIGKLPLYITVIIIAILTIAPSWVYAFVVSKDGIGFSGDFIGTGTQRSKVDDSFTLKAYNPGDTIRPAIVKITKPDGTIIEFNTNLLPGENNLGEFLADKPGTYICELKVSQSLEYIVLTGTLYATRGVGGIVVAVDKFALLAPYLGLASTIVVATVATAIYVKRRKQKQ